MAGPVAQTNDTSQAAATLERAAAVMIITVSAVVAAVGILHAEPLLSANDRSRWCTVWSLVERGTFTIDAITGVPQWDTIDKVRHEGHFYSSKPPLLSVMVAGVYWLVKQTFGLDLFRETAQTTRTILLIINLLPFVVSLSVLKRMLNRYARTCFTRLFVLLTAGLATTLTPFLVTLNNHTVAAAAVIFTLSPVLRILADGDRRWSTFAWAGFWAAFTVCNELPAAAMGLALFVLLFRTDPKRTCLAFVAAALVPLAAHFVTNWMVTDSLKPFYAYYGTEKYEYIVDGVPSYWLDPKGMDRAVDSPAVYFFHCTFGHHGIFSLTPVFLLALVTWCRPGLWRGSPLRSIVLLGLALTAIVLGFYLTRTENYNYGGNTAALRWAMWLIPFWLLALVPVLDAWQNSRIKSAVLSALLTVSMFSALWPMQNPWRQPWLFTLMDAAGWLPQYHPPRPQMELGRPLTTWIASLPELSEGETPQTWIELTGPGIHGQSVRLRIEDVGPSELQGRRVRHIAISHPDCEPSGDSTCAPRDFFIDTAAFAAGRPTDELLVFPDGASPAEREQAVTFLRGYPRPRTYVPGSIRYLHTSLRKDAFRCQLASAQVYAPSPDGSRELLYRSDVWVCPDVPFGVAQWLLTVTDPHTSTVLSRQLLTINATSAGTR